VDAPAGSPGARRASPIMPRTSWPSAWSPSSAERQTARRARGLRAGAACDERGPGVTQCRDEAAAVAAAAPEVLEVAHDQRGGVPAADAVDGVGEPAAPVGRAVAVLGDDLEQVPAPRGAGPLDLAGGAALVVARDVDVGDDRAAGADRDRCPEAPGPRQAAGPWAGSPSGEAGAAGAARARSRARGGRRAARPRSSGRGRPPARRRSARAGPAPRARPASAAPRWSPAVGSRRAFVRRRRGGSPRLAWGRTTPSAAARDGSSGRRCRRVAGRAGPAAGGRHGPWPDRSGRRSRTGRGGSRGAAARAAGARPAGSARPSGRRPDGARAPTPRRPRAAAR
jgi:hypothetical protein